MLSAMKRALFGASMFLLGAAAVAMAAAKPELVPLVPRRAASANQRLCADIGRSLGGSLGEAYTVDQVKGEVEKRIEAKLNAIDRLLAAPRSAAARDEFVRADGKLTMALARGVLVRTFCGLAKGELESFE